MKFEEKILADHKPVSQSCAVAETEAFWQATGQSNLADRMEDRSIVQSAAVWVRLNQTLEAFVAVNHLYT